MKEKLEKVSGIVISALQNSSLREAAAVDDSPSHLLELLDARYTSNRPFSRIASQIPLYRLR